MADIVKPARGEEGWDAATDAVIDAINALGGTAAADIAAKLAPLTPPTHAGTRTGSWDPARSLYNARAAALYKLRAQLGKAAAGTGLCRVACIGDSLTLGHPVTLGSQDPVRKLRDLFDAAGYPCGELVAVWNNFNRDERVTLGGAWSAGSLTSPWLTASGAGNTITVAIEEPGTVLEIVTRGTSAAFTYSVDGGSATAITPNSSNAVQVVTVTGLADKAHTVVLTSVSGTNYVHSVGIRRSSGMVFANVGLDSSSSADWATAGTFAALGSALLGADPDIVTIELGVNDAVQALSVANFQTNLASIVTSVKAAAADVLLIASNRPATTGPVPVSTSAFNTYLAAIYAVADSAGVPLLDMADRFGLYTQWNGDGLSADTVHLNAAGYLAKAQAVADVLNQAHTSATSPLTGGVRLYASSTGQVVLSGTTPVLDVNVIEFNDSTDLYAVDLSANTVTVARGGLFVGVGETRFNGGSAGFRAMAFQINGTSIRECALRDGVGGGEFAVSVTGMFRLKATDVVRAQLYADGGTDTPLKTTNLLYTGWGLVRVGD